MKQVHIVVGVVTIALTGAAGVWGAWCWWRVRSSAWFWRLLRASQVAVVIQAALGGVLLLMHRKAPGLHVLYGVLPLLVSFLAEQLKISSAQMVLDQRGFESAGAVGKLPADEQQDGRGIDLAARGRGDGAGSAWSTSYCWRGRR